MKKPEVRTVFLAGLLALLAAAPLQADSKISGHCENIWKAWTGNLWSSANSSGNSLPSSEPKPVLNPVQRVNTLREALEAKFSNSTVEHVGNGGRGIIMRVTDPTGNSAIFKFALDPEDHAMIATLTRDPKIIAKAKAADAEGSAHLVEVRGNVEVTTDTDETALVMGDASEGSLESHLADFGPGRPPLEVLDAWRQIALGLRSLHRAKITHRDIKPGNILLAKNVDGSTKYMVSDYDLVYEPGDYLRPGKVAGTAAYMSNDAMHGDSPIPRHDLHSLNIVFMEMLIGHSLYQLDWNDRANHVVPIIIFAGAERIPMLQELPDKTAAAVDPQLRKIVKKEYESIDDLIAAIDSASAEIKQAGADARTRAKRPKEGQFGWVSKLKEWLRGAVERLPPAGSFESKPAW